MSRPSGGKKLIESCAYRVRTVCCPHQKKPAEITASRWKTSDGQWTAWAIVDCPLLLAGLIDCDMSCLSQLDESSKTDESP